MYKWFLIPAPTVAVLKRTNLRRSKALRVLAFRQPPDLERCECRFQRGSFKGSVAVECARTWRPKRAAIGRWALRGCCCGAEADAALLTA
ncbi:hypothetical protein V6Z12_D05G375300 [Gossypium hirsutum]